MSARQNRRNKTLAVVATLIALGAVTGCHKKASGINPSALGPEPAAAPAPTATITADPLAIDLGQSVVLNWRSQNATSVTIDGIGPVNLNGTQTVSPSNSTDFHLTAKGDGGTTEANVRVTVRVPVAPTAPAPNEADMGSDAVFHQNVKDIFFDYDSYDLRPDATTSISQAASYLNAHPATRWSPQACPPAGFASSATAKRSSSVRKRTRPAGSRTAGPNSHSIANSRSPTSAQPSRESMREG